MGAPLGGVTVTCGCPQVGGTPLGGLAPPEKLIGVRAPLSVPNPIAHQGEQLHAGGGGHTCTSTLNCAAAYELVAGARISIPAVSVRLEPVPEFVYVKDFMIAIKLVPHARPTLKGHAGPQACRFVLIPNDSNEPDRFSTER